MCTFLLECFVVTVKCQTASWLHVSFKEGSGSNVALQGLRSSALQTAGLSAPPCLLRHFFLAAVYETEHQFLMEKTFLCVWVCVWGVCPCVRVYVCVFGVCVCYVVVDWVWVDEERMRHMIPELTSVLFWENVRLGWRVKTENYQNKKQQRHFSVNKSSKTPNMVLKANVGLK